MVEGKEVLIAAEGWILTTRAADYSRREEMLELRPTLRHKTDVTMTCSIYTVSMYPTKSKHLLFSSYYS